MNYLILSFILLIISSFNNKDLGSKIGDKYVMDLKYKFIELEINKDSTFFITDNRWTKYGTWQINSDTIYFKYLKLTCSADDCLSELRDTSSLAAEYVINGDYLHPLNNYKNIQKKKRGSWIQSFERIKE